MENDNIGNVDLYYTYYNGTDEYSDFLIILNYYIERKEMYDTKVMIIIQNYYEKNSYMGYRKICIIHI